MSGFTLVSIGVVVFLALRSFPAGTRTLAAVSTALGLANPIAGLGLAVAWFSLQRRRTLKSRRMDVERAEGEIEILVHSIRIGLSGGLSPTAALALAGQGLHSSLAEEVDGVLRRSVQDGLANSLLDSTGVAGRLFRQVGAAHLTGAPLELSLGALATEYRNAARARAVERARQLPVRMVVPLTLLMLPGVVILMVGPLVLPAAVRLLGPIMSI